MTTLHSPEMYVSALKAAGWGIAAYFRYYPGAQQLEGLVHEIAHNYVLGERTPKGVDETARLVRESGTLGKQDQDEILVTAITVQCMETFFGILNETEESLVSCRRNMQATLAHDAEAYVINQLNTPYCQEMARTIFEHAQECVRRYPGRAAVDFVTFPRGDL